MQMPTKGNVVLYLDKELVEKSKELGFNLSKTFENHLKQLLNGNSPISLQNNGVLEDNKIKWWAEPDSDRRPLARKANVLTRLDDRPTQVFDKRTTLVNIRILFLKVAIYLDFAVNKKMFYLKMDFAYSFAERLLTMLKKGGIRTHSAVEVYHPQNLFSFC